MPYHITTLGLHHAEALTNWFNVFVDQDIGIVENYHVTLEQEISYINSLAERIQQHKLFTLIAEEKDEIVGKIDLIPLSRYIDKHVVEISFGVLREHPEAGMKLLKEAEVLAASHGYEELIYYILDSNATFLTIFEKRDFMKVGEIKNFYKKEHQYFHRVILQKSIRA